MKKRKEDLPAGGMASVGVRALQETSFNPCVEVTLKNTVFARTVNIDNDICVLCGKAKATQKLEHRHVVTRTTHPIEWFRGSIMTMYLNVCTTCHVTSAAVLNRYRRLRIVKNVLLNSACIAGIVGSVFVRGGPGSGVAMWLVVAFFLPIPRLMNMALNAYVQRTSKGMLPVADVGFDGPATKMSVTAEFAKVLEDEALLFDTPRLAD